MEANQESLLSSSKSSLSTGDSSQLSNYLDLQAPNAGNHLCYYRKPMILSHSKLLLASTAQKEDAEAPWPSSSNAALSSAALLPCGSFTALKENPDSFIAREGSSQALSELDQSRGDPIFLYRTPLSSLSCIENSECYESGAETTKTIDMNGESLPCSKSKELDAWAGTQGLLNARSGVSADNMEVHTHGGPSTNLDNMEPTEKKMGVDHNASTESTVAFQHKAPSGNRVRSGHRASSKKIGALDLLVYAAIQVGLLDDEDDQNCDAFLSHAKRTDLATSDACHSRYEDAFPVHLNSPILKKRVVRRARSAFSKHTGSNSLLQRLGVSSPAKTSMKKVNKKNNNSINILNEDHLQQRSRAILYTQKKMFSEGVVACKTHVSETIHMENGGGSKKGVLKASPTKASDNCNTYLRRVRMKESQCKTQQSLQILWSPELPGPVSKSLEYAMKDEMCKDVCQVDSISGQKNVMSNEKCREAISEVEAQHVVPVKNGSSRIRLKIHPMRSPSQVLQEVHIFEGCKHAESKTITRRSKRLQLGEHESRMNVTMQPIDLMQDGEYKKGTTVTMNPMDLMLCDSSGSVDTQAEDVDLSFRSKRARSQVLPTKFSDSVLQPWKRNYRKKC